MLDAMRVPDSESRSVGPFRSMPDTANCSGEPHRAPLTSKALTEGVVVAFLTTSSRAFGLAPLILGTSMNKAAA
jgi:hypothetical protein